jgi:hypothetical protein
MWVSWQSLLIWVFSVQFKISTLPKLWGQYAVWSCQVIFSPFVSYLAIFDTKAGPLSDPMEIRIPHLGFISFNKAWTTFWAYPVRVGKASIHPEKVHTITIRYLSFSFFFEVISLYIYIYLFTWRVVKAHLESVYILTVLLAASYRARVSAMSSAFCAWASKTEFKVNAL